MSQLEQRAGGRQRRGWPESRGLWRRTREKSATPVLPIELQPYEKESDIYSKDYVIKGSDYVATALRLGLYHSYYRSSITGLYIYILLPEQQLKWFLLTLILSAVILFLIGILIFYITKSLSKRVLGEEKRNVDIIFAGAIIVALSQLFGPLFGASYPLILGPDASNYKLSFSSMYYNITYDEISENYTFTSTDNNGTIEDYHFHRGELIRIHTNISAENKNPLMKYEDQIFLDLVPPGHYLEIK